MALESYRRQRVISNSANADFDQVIMLNAGDVDGRIVRFEAAKGNGRAATACKLWIDKGEGLAVFCELIRVDMPTPTWEAAIPVRGLDVGVYDAAIRLEDVDGSITETMPIRVQVIGSILAESEATEEMQDALDDFEIRTRAALADIAEAIIEAETATTDAQAATTSATGAAQSANTAAQNIGASVDAQGILTVTDADGTATTYDGAATAAQSATSAAERATDAAISAETAAGNIGAEVDSSGIVTVTDANGTQTTYDGLADAVLLARGAAERADDAAVNANAAKTAANSAALSANSAATSATSAAGTATGAAETATSAASSANTAATSATSSANAATAAANSATSAASSANSAATSANNAATAATTATTNANTATTNANSATTAANTAAQSATDAAAAANAAAEDATDAATEARDAAAAALASVGNVVIGEISMLDGSIETVDDAWPSPLRGIEVSGKSTQASYSGSQIWQPNMQYESTTGATCTVVGYDATVISTNASLWQSVRFTVPDYNFVAGDALTFSADVAAGSSNYAGFLAFDANGSELKLTRNYTDTTKLTVTLTIPEGTASVVVILYARRTAAGSVGDECKYSNIMLNAGSTALPWEPYVGGIPSPNPDFPQTIHSVAEAGQVVAGRNLLNMGLSAGYYYNPSIIESISNNVLSLYIRPSGLTYTINGARLPGAGTYKISHKASYTDTGYAGPRTLIRLRNVDNTAWLTNNDVSISGFTYNANYSAWYKDVSTKDTSLTVTIPECGFWCLGFGLNTYGGTIATGATIAFSEAQVSPSVFADGYQPYESTTTPLIPSGVEPLRSLPNGVHDELVVHEDGSREIVRRVKSVTLDGTESWTYIETSTWKFRHTPADLSTLADPTNPALVCDKYTPTPWSGSSAAYGISVNNTSTLIAIRDPDYQSKAAFAEALAANPVTVLYPIVTPVTEPLPSITMPSAPSSDVTSWLDSKDETSAPITTDSSVAYERSMQIVIDRLEQAIADI